MEDSIHANRLEDTRHDNIMEDTSMSISPIYVDSTPLTYHTFSYDDDTLVPMSTLDVSKFSMYLIQNGTTRAGTGTFSNFNASTSSVWYRMSAADTATAGVCELFPVVELANDDRPFDPQQIVIIDLNIP
jgi:hypothetical protein